jgi:glycosyltransferase involved in cell wall biosynthesis
MKNDLRVLMITSEWPTPEKPWQVPFIVRQVEYLRRAGLTVDVHPFRGGKNPLNYFKAWIKAQRAIRGGKYDLIHAQWGQSGLMALPKRQPLVVTFRGDDLEGLTDENGDLTPLGRVLRRISRMVAAQANEVILVSGHMARFIDRRTYHVIPSGLDLEVFCPAPQGEARRRLGLKPGTKYVLFAGSVSNPRKRHALAREAVELLSQEMDVELLTVTSVSHDQIPDFMNASDALLLLSQHEGSPNVVKEALACNLPVISTDVGDVRERIGSFAGCVILNDLRPEQVAAEIRRILQRGERLNSRSTVLDLDENVITGKVIEVYHKAVAVY